MSEHAHPPAFEMVVAGVIVANTGLLVWPLVDGAHEELLARLESACLAFFVVELLIRLRRHGWRFFRTPWNVADTAIIAFSLLPALGVGVTMLRVGRLARLMHVGRHVTHLRLLRLATLLHWRLTSGGPPLTIGGR